MKVSGPNPSPADRNSSASSPSVPSLASLISRCALLGTVELLHRPTPAQRRAYLIALAHAAGAAGPLSEVAAQAYLNTQLPPGYTLQRLPGALTLLVAVCLPIAAEAWQCPN